MCPMQIGNQILLIAYHQYRNVFDVSTLGDLIPNYSYVLKGLQIGQIEYENISVCVSQSVESEIGPLDEAVGRKVRYRWQIGYL